MHRSRSTLLLPLWLLLVAATAVFATLGWTVRPIDAYGVAGTMVAITIIALLLAEQDH
jgi:hypothetical protein